MKIFSTILLLFIAFISNAQWSTNSKVNTPICTNLSKQKDPRIIDDGVGGAYIAWKDWRNASTPDIYIQRINKDGVILWTSDGISACNDPKDQSTPNMIRDKNYGVIVTWSDWRSLIERDLYAQRFDSSGNIKWAYNGAVVANKTNREHNEKIITDTANGCIVIWEQQSAGYWDVWGQHLDSNGAPKWGIGGKALCGVLANRLNPKVQADGAGGAFVVWQDFRSNIDYDIYGQRIDAAGNLMWGNAAKLIGGGFEAQIDPKIDPDKSVKGFYVSWIDKRNGLDYDIYAQRVDSTGNGLWAANGVSVIESDSNQTAQDMLSTSNTGGLIVTWKDNRSGNYDVYAQAINADGSKRWASSGVPLVIAAKDQLNPNICSDNSTGAIITWQHGIGTQFDIRAQHIDANGNVLWTPGGSIISDADSSQLGPKNIADGNGGSIIVWEDLRKGNIDVYCNRVTANGTLWPLALIERSVNHTVYYPNPFSDFVVLENANFTSKNEIIILNIYGQTISNFVVENMGNNKIKIANLEALPKGVYSIIIKSSKEFIKVVKN
jgi:predicted lipoprotein with Yx(FWY)xxD motif